MNISGYLAGIPALLQIVLCDALLDWTVALSSSQMAVRRIRQPFFGLIIHTALLWSKGREI